MWAHDFRVFVPSWWHVVGEHCSPHGGQREKRERRGQSANIPLKVKSPLTYIKLGPILPGVQQVTFDQVTLGISAFGGQLGPKP